MRKKAKNKIRFGTPLFFTVLATFLLLATSFYWYKSFQDKFTPPREYSPVVEFRVSEKNSLMAVTSNLAYYGFVKDEDALKYALKHTKDNTPGGEEAIKIGNGTIDTQAVYKISQSMTAWEIARILLNEGTPSVSNCDHGCPSTNPFTPEILPGGDIAPSLQEQMSIKYSWVKTFDDCIKAIGHDGGQVTSKEASKRTGHPRVCNTPDSRYFVEGKEGWTKETPYP